MEKDREFKTAKLNCVYRGNRIEFEIDNNLEPEELNEVVNFWIPNTEKHTAESLCEFIHSFDPEFRAYTPRDKKLLQWVVQQSNITRC